MKKLPFPLCLRALFLTAVASISGSSLAQEPVRIGFMDPLSGAFASIGTSGLKQIQFAADYLFNSRGGILDGRMIEIVPLDNQLYPVSTYGTDIARV
ncbi:MAG: ABC transporter substrate-binding protein [Gammaproteobacteria bacterium]|jgi:branched-chain amino acid transport system substrate-binding protein|nr:ABC transporter substrate-binding protein [Gammaproteobacteria bacterium]MDP6734159.1 ABC transporter substrate-binding protein [Gammaproteobacteria bacterium]|tara:strand:+ start:1822 stop:2112 length:291 start_codon:yes stop_codon:yes gene_type:complete